MSNVEFRSNPNMHGPKSGRDVATAPLLVLLGTSFVDMIGFSIVLPLLPYYAKEFGATDWLVGPLIASFSVAQLSSTPFWGAISDRYGRRPLILAGLAFSTVSYVLFGLATTVSVLFVSRIVQGASGGTVGVAQAYVADTTAPERRAQVIGWLSAVTSAAFMIGPAIGSWAFQVGGPRAPGLFAAGLCLTNLIFALRFLPEPSPSALTERKAKVPPLRAVLAAALRDPVRRMIAIYFLGIGAFSSITAIFPLYLLDRFGIDETTIGYVFVYVGVVSLLVRALAVGPLVHRFGEPVVTRAGSLGLVAGLLIAVFANSFPILALSLTFIAAGTGTLFPPLAALISRSTGPEVQGSMLGINQFFGGVARVIGPLWGAAVFDFYSSGTPFGTAAVWVVLAFVLTLGLRVPTREEAAPAAASQTSDVSAS